MNINQAMAVLYSNESDKKRLNDWFYTYCVLADLCHETFEDVRLVKTFRAVSQKISVFDTLLTCGTEKGLKQLKCKYVDNFNGISDECAFSDYKKIVFAVVGAIDPRHKVSVKKSKKPLQQLAYEFCAEAVQQQNEEANKQCEQLAKKCEKLAKDFHDYFWKKYCSFKGFHFIKRRRILNTGYDWYRKILSAPSIKKAKASYENGKKAIDEIR